jgi:hypothetical protein
MSSKWNLFNNMIVLSVQLPRLESRKIEMGRDLFSYSLYFLAAVRRSSRKIVTGWGLSQTV